MYDYKEKNNRRMASLTGRVAFATVLFLTGTMPVFAAPPGAGTLDPASAAGFVPHKALYELKLSAKSSSSKVSNITGKMVYEWQPSCDAWISNHHFDVTYDYLEMPSLRVTSNFSTYESFDGKSFNFSSQRKREGVVFEELRGNIEYDDQGSAKAVYSLPQDLSFDLPEGTLFPMAHTLDVLDKINKGKKFYQATVFDGSDDQGPVEINSFVGKTAEFVPPAEYQEYIAKELISDDALKMRLAFFPLEKAQVSSDYEMSLLFHKNGVISDMEVDYGDFSVSQKLVAIEPLSGTCDSDKKGEK